MLLFIGGLFINVVDYNISGKFLLFSCCRVSKTCTTLIPIYIYIYIKRVPFTIFMTGLDKWLVNDTFVTITPALRGGKKVP